MEQLSFLEELKWRGLIHDITPGLEEVMQAGTVRGYIGFDPTAPSLTIGNYVQVMLLTFLQRAGHQPVVLMGGATGRIGDPSGKDKERDLKSYEELDGNLAFQIKQVEQMLDFSPERTNGALLVNNYDFYKDMGVLAFLRDVGKYTTVNTMLAKESVKRRLESGISFTEFSYQLIQGYDFVVLNRDLGVRVQMGGSDQYGNIIAGVEMNRRILDEKVFAVTTPLLTKADGTKFGKSAEGNIWMDAKLTSPYKFYQFWLNATNEDMPKYLKYFSLKPKEEILALEAKIQENPQEVVRIFAEEMTTRIHGEEAFQSVLLVTRLIWDHRMDADALQTMSADELQTVSQEIPSPEVSATDMANGLGILDLLAEKAAIFASKGEVRNAIKNNAISINKVKVTAPEYQITKDMLLHGKYLMVENGKKNKYMVVVNDEY